MNKAFTKEEIADIQADLWEVGKTKGLGYLPLGTLKKCGLSVDEVLAFAKENSLKYILFDRYAKGVCDVVSGAFYLYDEGMLQEILHANKDVLRKAGVPFEHAEGYIRHISGNLVNQQEYPEAYIVVAKTFNDARYRT